jgi:hypothetical protein
MGAYVPGEQHAVGRHAECLGRESGLGTPGCPVIAVVRKDQEVHVDAAVHGLTDKRGRSDLYVVRMRAYGEETDVWQS